MSMPDITVGAWFAARAARSPKRRALTFEGASWTFAEPTGSTASPQPFGPGA